MARVRNIRPVRSSRTAARTTAALVVTLALGVLAPQARAADAAADRPARGLTMAQVEARYGAPADRASAVGQPPITRWEYPGLVVYFENDRVVHAVVTGAPPPAAPAAVTGG